jgi:hypothetical protein
MSEEVSIVSRRLIIRYSWHLQGSRNRLRKTRKLPALFWDVTACMLVVGTDVRSLTNYRPTQRKIQGAKASQLHSGRSLKSDGNPGSNEVSIRGDSLCVNRNVITYIDISIRLYGNIFDIVAYRCLIFFVCYSNRTEYFIEFLQVEFT